jgi:tRNA A-37 threonylcarbamoyl transferase component Bud32
MPFDIEDAEQLLPYLRANGRIGADEPVTITVLAGGVSNRTVLVKRADGTSWVLKQALAKLRVAVDWFSDPARIHREADGMRWLQELAPPGAVPRLVFEDTRDHVLAMDAAPEPHANWKALLLAGDLDPDHFEQWGRLLGTIHRRSSERRDELAVAFEDRSFFESLRLEPYYAYSAAQVPAAAPFLHALISDTRSRRLSVVHGDYSPKNILVHAGRLILLDHEVIHFGDPAFDLGFSLAHLLSKAHHLRAHRDRLAEAALRYVRAYDGEVGGLVWTADLPNHAVRHTLACLLARVAGRSPLEYLDETERRRQREAAVHLMTGPPSTMDDLIALFVGSL